MLGECVKVILTCNEREDFECGSRWRSSMWRGRSIRRCWWWCPATKCHCTEECPHSSEPDSRSRVWHCHSPSHLLWGQGLTSSDHWYALSSIAESDVLSPFMATSLENILTWLILVSTIDTSIMLIFPTHSYGHVNSCLFLLPILGFTIYFTSHQ